MKRISIITLALLIITLFTGTITNSVFAHKKQVSTLSQNEEFVTPTEVPTTITETPNPTNVTNATGAAALITITSLGASESANVTNSSAAGQEIVAQVGAQQSSGQTAGQTGGAAAQNAQSAGVSQSSNQAASQGQTLGSSTMAPTGLFAQRLMNMYAIFGVLLLMAGFTSYAQEKRTI